MTYLRHFIFNKNTSLYKIPYNIKASKIKRRNASIILVFFLANFSIVTPFAPRLLFRKFTIKNLFFGGSDLIK